MTTMKYIKTILINLLAALLTIAGAQAQDTLSLTLELCRTMALDNSKKVKIAQENISKAKGQKIAARSAWLPNISASATGIYKNLDFEEELYLPTQVLDPMTGELVPNIALNPLSGEPIMGSDGNPVFNSYAYMPLDISIYGGAMASVMAEQPLFAGGKIIAANKMATIGENMAYENEHLEKINTTYQADQAYYTYLSVNEKVVLALNYQNLLSQLVQVVDDSYQMGMTNRNELLKVQVRSNEVALQVQKAKNGLELARMALCQVVGVDFSTPIFVADSIHSLSENMALYTADAKTRIEYQLLQGQVKLAQQNVNMVRAAYLPTAGVSAGYSYFNLGIRDIDNYSTQGPMVMASVKIPITTFGEMMGKIKSAKADLQIKELELHQSGEYLQLEIEQAYLNYSDALTRVEMTRHSLKQARENLRISRDNYDLGMETLVNLLEAQAEWQKAYSNKIDALTDMKIKESNYLRVAKGLNME